LAQRGLIGVRQTRMMPFTRAGESRLRSGGEDWMELLSDIHAQDPSMWERSFTRGPFGTSLMDTRTGEVRQ
jgi:hypothetical protein